MIQFHYWQLNCSDFIFLLISVLGDFTFLGICPFLLCCLFYWHIVVSYEPLYLWSTVIIYSLSFLITSANKQGESLSLRKAQFLFKGLRILRARMSRTWADTERLYSGSVIKDTYSREQKKKCFYVTAPQIFIFY